MSKYEGVLKMFNINFLNIFDSLRIIIRPPSTKGTTHKIKVFSNHKSQNIMNYKPAHKECVVRYSDLVAPKSGSRLKKRGGLHTVCVKKGGGL